MRRNAALWRLTSKNDNSSTEVTEVSVVYFKPTRETVKEIFPLITHTLTLTGKGPAETTETPITSVAKIRGN